MNKAQNGFKMTNLYKMVRISKQAHYKRVEYREKMADLTQDILVNAQELRKDHKRMGCRKIYSEIKPNGIGRDRTEAILLSNGFRLKRKRNYKRTTYAGERWYSNRISGIEVTGLNQLWVSDITYIPMISGHFYLTLVQDVYSRKITGWQLSSDLRTSQTVLPAYQMGIASIDRNQRRGLIFHSDKGSQYGWKQLEAIHEENGVLPSMGGKAWENAHAESINGVLKNEYINFENMRITLGEARKILKRIIYLYNTQRPHGSLKNMKPVEFETSLEQLTAQGKPILKINY